jgi:hypothetical protein
MSTWVFVHIFKVKAHEEGTQEEAHKGSHSPVNTLYKYPSLRHTPFLRDRGFLLLLPQMPKDAAGGGTGEKVPAWEA